MINRSVELLKKMGAAYGTLYKYGQEFHGKSEYKYDQEFHGKSESVVPIEVLLRIAVQKMEIRKLLGIIDPPQILDAINLLTTEMCLELDMYNNQN